MKEFAELVKIVRRLRGPGGCPWDRKQRITDYKSFLIEEAYECIDALSGKNIERIEEELGDLLLLIVSITHIFAEKGKFNIERVLRRLNKKLVDRHPHVFSTKKLKTASSVLEQWYGLKFKERKNHRHFSHIPSAMPSLMKAYKAVKEAVKRGKI